MQRQDLAYLLLLVGFLRFENAIGAGIANSARFFTYQSDEPGCRANPATDLELIAGEGKQWVVVAPARVVFAGRVQTYASLSKAPLDLEIAKPLELAIQNKVAAVPRDSDHQSGITRIKIVSVWHGVLGLGMGEAVPQIALRFRICTDSDVSEGAIQEVARNGPKMNTLWHQPRGEELQHGFQKAAELAFSTIADLVLRPEQ